MTHDATVLVVEDDDSIADLVREVLGASGFRVLRSSTGAEALEAVRQRAPSVVILDIGLPGEMDGFDVLRELRSISDAMVLVLTARGDEVDRVVGLEMGADDYVSKPFSPRELVARVKALLRRSKRTAEEEVIDLGSIVVDCRRREALLEGSPVELTAREYALLEYLARNRGLALTRRQILDGVWGSHWVGDERTVDVHIRQLRRKLGDALNIRTMRGIGYRLD